MTPMVQAVAVALAGVFGCFLMFRFVVPLFPGDGRAQERLAAMRKAQAEREAAAKVAE